MAQPTEFVMSFHRFAQTIPLGHADHVLLGAVRVLHGSEKHLASEWRALMKVLKAQPATSGVKRIG